MNIIESLDTTLSNRGESYAQCIIRLLTLLPETINKSQQTILLILQITVFVSVIALLTWLIHRTAFLVIRQMKIMDNERLIRDKNIQERIATQHDGALTTLVTPTISLTYRCDADRLCRQFIMDHDFTDGHVAAIYRNSATITTREVDLSKIAQKVKFDPNAGGNSVFSEVMSAELFSIWLGASSIKTEMEITYWCSNWKIADFSICVRSSTGDGSELNPNTKWIGVSVTRAMGWPKPEAFTLNQARDLMYKKISGLLLARNATTPEDSFFTSIVHVWCQSREIADMVMQATREIQTTMKHMECFVCITVCDDPRIYSNVM